MRWFLTLAAVLVALPASANRLSYREGVLRVAGVARGGNRSVWARSKVLAVVLPAQSELEDERLEIGESVIRDARLRARSGRTEVELRLNQPAERLLGRIQLSTDGSDLVLRLHPADAVPPALLESSETARSASNRAISPAPPTATAESPDSPTASPISDAKDQGGKQDHPLPNRAKPQGAAWPPPQAQQSADSPPLQKVWALVGLLVAASAGVWWWRKRQRSFPPCQTGISIVTARALSPRHKLMLVEVAGDTLLLACTDKGITLLRRLKPRESRDDAPIDSASDQLIESALQRADASQDRVQLSSRTTHGQQVPPQPEAPYTAAPQGTEGHQHGDFIARLSEQLRQRRPEERPAELLGENWAEGILRLRRARRQAREGDQSTVH
jgi:flagellar biogenesis protein FliO